MKMIVVVAKRRDEEEEVEEAVSNNVLVWLYHTNRIQDHFYIYFIYFLYVFKTSHIFFNICTWKRIPAAAKREAASFASLLLRRANANIISHQRRSSLDTFLSREIQDLGSCRRLFLDHKKKESFQNEQYHSITIPPYHLTANMSTEVKSAVFAADDPIWIDNVWVDTVVVVGLTCFILCLMGLSKVCVCSCEE